MEGKFIIVMLILGLLSIFLMMTNLHYVALGCFATMISIFIGVIITNIILKIKNKK